MKPIINIKRVYDKPLKKDGFRILVDRLWPRGVKKEEAAVDEWAKELAPSSNLRKWFNHDPERWAEFQEKYTTELKSNKAVSEFTATHNNTKTITLVYAAKDTEHTHVIVLQQYLSQKFKE